MALFNYATKEITLKIVYYGPGLSGKTTNLQYLHSILNPQSRGKLLSLATETDRTLFFDFLPVELGKIRDFSVRFQLYTVPGQVCYNATRKVVLKGADGVVFVADSQVSMLEQNSESLANMNENLRANNIDPKDIPLVLQYNKRDISSVSTVEEMNDALNPESVPVIEAAAINGAGVEETFRLITKHILQNISKKHSIEVQEPETVEDAGEHDIAQAVPEITDDVECMTAERSGDENTPTMLEPVQDLSSARETTFHFTDHGTEEREEMWQDIKKTGETSPTPGRDLELIVSEMKSIHEIVMELKISITGMRNDLKVLNELKKEQEDIAKLLRSLMRSVDEITHKKRKKRWFRFS